MKIGTILENDWTGKENPIHYSIYIGSSGGFVDFIYETNGKIKKGYYFKEDVGEHKEIHPIRESDVLERMTALLRDELRIQET